jgi:indoleacetamide hydrolase
MSYGLTGHNERYGQVKNPHAAIACRAAPQAAPPLPWPPASCLRPWVGDTVGSIRVPASLCGVVGFKPTTGRWPRSGVAPISHTLDTTGVCARSVEDCILMDQVVTRGQAVQPFHGGYDVKGARLAYAPRQFLDLVDPEVEARFREVVRRVQEAGAEVVEVDLGDDFGTLIRTATWSIFFHETMGAISEFLRRHDIPTTFQAIYEGLKPQLREAWGHMVLPEGGGAISARVYQTALEVSRPEIQRRLNDRALLDLARRIEGVLGTWPAQAPI